MTQVRDTFLERSQRALEQVRLLEPVGKLTVAKGLLTAKIPAFLGELVEIEDALGHRSMAEVIGFSETEVQLMPYSHSTRIQRGDRVHGSGQRMRVPVGWELLGRIINGSGGVLDGGPSLSAGITRGIDFTPPTAMSREPVNRPFQTGQRVIDGLLTMGEGQRMGLFAGSGVGKSTLLGQIARYADSDVNVVALIGERGREVRPFIEESLGTEGLERSVVVLATSDETALARVRAAETAVTIAAWFRQQGKRVFLMLDSLTRYAMAQRELGLLLGEPPTSRGYTPSVFQKLAQLLEQLGTDDRGCITALLTVLVDGDDMNDPIADAARSILDGHIVLDRDLANSGHFPAVDVLRSASRVFENVAGPDQCAAAQAVRRCMARYQEVIDLVQVGAYAAGVSPETDLAIQLQPAIDEFLRQPLHSPSQLPDTVTDLQRLAQLTRMPTNRGRSQEARA